MTPPTRIAAVLLGVLSLAHILRVALGVPVTVADSALPMWVSYAAAAAAGWVAVMLWRDRR